MVWGSIYPGRGMPHTNIRRARRNVGARRAVPKRSEQPESPTQGAACSRLGTRPARPDQLVRQEARGPRRAARASSLHSRREGFFHRFQGRLRTDFKPLTYPESQEGVCMKTILSFITFRICVFGRYLRNLREPCLFSRDLAAGGRSCEGARGRCLQKVTVTFGFGIQETRSRGCLTRPARRDTLGRRAYQR